MFILTALGEASTIQAAAALIDTLDPNPADAVSWFEEGAGRFRLEAYVEEAADGAALQDLLAAHFPALAARIEPVKDADWVAMSLDGLPPVRAGRFVVAGAHALAQARRGPKPIWIEASEAFGTGHHGTTRGCLLALEHVLARRRVRRCLDLGAGSGVLAIAAALTGARSLAVEIDPRAAEIAAVNVANNRVGARVRVRAMDGAKAARAAGPAYDLVFANILMRPLIAMAGPIAGAVAPGGTLVLSGLLTTQEPLIRLAYSSRNLHLSRRIRLEAWSTLVWRRPLAR